MCFMCSVCCVQCVQCVVCGVSIGTNSSRGMFAPNEEIQNEANSKDHGRIKHCHLKVS